MENFLEKYTLPKLNQEEAESLTRLVPASEIEAVVKEQLAHKSPVQECFTGEFYQTFKEELTPILHRLFEKIQEQGRLPNCCYEASIILIPKPDKHTIKKENYRPFCC